MKNFNPIVSFLFFAAVIGFSMFLMHPVALGISLFWAVVYLVRLGGRFNSSILMMVAIGGLMNPLFNHQGATILGFLPNGNPLTLESIAFGAAAAVMFATVIIWFSCFNIVMTSEKLLYLFGRISPQLSLLLSMVLRLVPRFKAQAVAVANAQKGLGVDLTRGKISARAKAGVMILGMLASWVLQNSIETADSMKARGYGRGKRMAFSIFRLRQRDFFAIMYILACVVVVIVGVIAGEYSFRYFPTIRGEWSWTVFVAYFMLLGLPCLEPWGFAPHPTNFLKKV